MSKLPRTSRRPVIGHVNQQILRHNAKYQSSYPALTIKHPTEGTFYCFEAEGFSRLVDSNAQGRAPLSCGARIWVEYTLESFAVIGPRMSWPQLKQLLSQDREAAALSAALETQTLGSCPAAA